MSLDTDRIAVSNELGGIADRFALEATRWADKGTSAECLRLAGVLNTLSRGALTSGHLDVLEAYAAAGDIQLRKLIGARKLITSLTPPRNGTGS